MRRGFTRGLQSAARAGAANVRGAAALAAAVVAAFLLLPGCGDALEAFRDDLRPLEDQAELERSQIAATLRSLRLGNTRDARTLRAHASELERLHDEIAALEPPDEHEEAFDAYVRANDRLVRDLERFASEVAAGDAAGLERASVGVTRALGQAQTARLRWLE